MKRKISKRGYRVLAIVWAMASASMAVAAIRQLPTLNPPTLLLLAASLVAATSFWKTYKTTPDVDKPDQKTEEKKHG